MKLGASPSDYWSAMDRQGYVSSIANIGGTTHPAKNQLQEMKAKIFKGAGAIELGFMGKGKGVLSQGNTTPEMHGREEREAMRDLAKINKVKLSTHASVAVGNWSGLTENKFDENAREQNIFEGKRAIDFAADVAEGGPVVIHTGEYPRPISTPEKEQFESLAERKGQRVHYLMDKKTGQLITAVREDQTNFLPVYEEEEETDAWGRKIKHIKWEPKYKEGGELEVKEYNWDYYKKWAEENRKAGRQDPKDPSTSDDPAVLFYYHHLEGQRLQARGQADEYEYAYRRERENREKILKEYQFWEKNWDKIKPEDRWKYMETIPVDSHGRVDPHIRDRKEYLKRLLQDTEKQMNYGREIAASARSQEHQIKDQQKRVESLRNFALKKSTDSIAEMAIYAMKQQEDKELKKDLFIAPENIFPEMGYGSHPDELRHLVEESRKKMADKLVEDRKGMSRSQAEELAANHIKATFDIGHANTWKKYFKGKPKDFQKWLLEQVKQLNKAGVLGHVHITDNFGYYDEHLSPGQGNVPVKDFVKELKKGGYKGQITVETADQDYKAMTEMWRLVNSPVYKIGGATRGWTDIEFGYFGRTSSPRYLVGETVPDPKTWTLWSEIPLE